MLTAGTRGREVPSHTCNYSMPPIWIKGVCGARGIVHKFRTYDSAVDVFLSKFTLGSSGGSIFYDFVERWHKRSQCAPKEALESARMPQGVTKRSKASTNKCRRPSNVVPEVPNGDHRILGRVRKESYNRRKLPISCTSYMS
jgi:hypothetical protein